MPVRFVRQSAPARRRVEGDVQTDFDATCPGFFAALPAVIAWTATSVPPAWRRLSMEV